MKILCIILGGFISLTLSLNSPSKQSGNSSSGSGNATGLSVHSGGNAEMHSGDSPEVYIVGGTAAGRNEFPWLVHLYIEGLGFCGGSLIDMNLVLTAAHCVVLESGKTVSAKKIKVTAGDHNLNAVDGSEQERTASGVKAHEGYKQTTFVNDIAMIRVDRNFTSTTQVRPIGLPTSFSGSWLNGTVAGWGSIQEGGGTSNILYKVQVPIVKDRTCDSQMSNSSGQFCAGGKSKDSCQGDSGGPFICANASNLVCGIVSYGEGCGRENKPGVYTKVFSYTSWIRKNWNFSSSSPIFSSGTLVCLASFFAIHFKNSVSLL